MENLNTKDFESFCLMFKNWQVRLNCQNYMVDFIFEEKIKDAHASIEIHDGNQATVKLSKTRYEDFPGLEYLAKHEALHLFLYNVIGLLPNKIKNSKVLNQLEEGMVIALERYLRG